MPLILSNRFEIQLTMKTVKFCFLTAVAVVLSASCSRDGIVTLDIASGIAAKPDRTGIEAIAKDIRTVELKGEGLYDIRIFGESDGTLYGRTADNILAVFSEDGRLLYSFDRKGRGPGEYLTPFFRFDGFRDEIIIYDFQNKVIRYDAEGNYIDEVRNEVTSSLADIVPLDDSSYVATIMSHLRRDSSLLYLDRNLSVIGSALPIFNQAQTSQRGLIVAEPIYVFNSDVMFIPRAEDTYYRYEEGVWRPFLKMGQGRYRMPAGLSVSVGQYEEKGKYMDEMGAYIAGRYVFVCYAYHSDQSYFYDVYDIKTGKRLIHNRRTEEEVYDDGNDGWILNYDGMEYVMFPHYVKDNVIYSSVFGEDGTTTLFRITL